MTMVNSGRVTIAWERTHYQDQPEQRLDKDRRTANCFISKDRRSGIGCRRIEKIREMERRVALSKVTFYPDYYPVR